MTSKSCRQKEKEKGEENEKNVENERRRKKELPPLIWTILNRENEEEREEKL